MPTDGITMWQQENVSRVAVFELLTLLLQRIRVSLDVMLCCCVCGS